MNIMNLIFIILQDLKNLYSVDANNLDKRKQYN
jgi:hypothetical protein